MGIKGVIVAAGYGTRFLPVTKTLPKEMLPLVDRPAIDFIVEEFVDAGITEILVISSRRKKVMEDWFDREVELESVFEREGAHHKAEKIVPRNVEVFFTRQQQMRGTGQALLLAKPFVGDDAMVVAYPDDLFGQPNCTKQLVETYRETGCTVLSAHDLSGEDVSRYGVLDVHDAEGHTAKVRSMVEKPPQGSEPSTLVSLGRYLYTPDIFPILEAGWAEHQAKSGEYFQTDPINQLAAQGRVVSRVVDAPRWDTGAPLGYLQTVIEVALQRDDLREPLTNWLKQRLG